MCPPDVSEEDESEDSRGIYVIIEANNTGMRGARPPISSIE
jgi:hypothetical protein